MECWPLNIIDRGAKGVLEDRDKIETRSELRKRQTGQRICQTKQVDPLTFFSKSHKEQSPLEKLRAIVEADPKIRKIHPKLISFILKKQHEWNGQNGTQPSHSPRHSSRIPSRSYFSSSKGEQSPMERLMTLLQTRPTLKTLPSNLLTYIIKEQRYWMMEMTGH